MAWGDGTTGRSTIPRATAPGLHFIGADIEGRRTALANGGGSAMRILVAYASKMGGTEGLARAVGDGLADAGHVVDVASVDSARDLTGYDAVIVGSALYVFRWYRPGRRFVRRHLKTLQALPVWFFSSGPTDDSASKGDIPPVKGVAALMERVGARGHATFGGRLAADAPGFMAQMLVKRGMVGDFRDMGQATAWGRGIGEELAKTAAPKKAPARAGPVEQRPEPPRAR